MNQDKATFLYIRITAKDEATGTSELQGRALAQWCTENQIKIFQVFADRRSPRLTDDRPAYKRMMAKVKEGECANLIVLSLSRLARSKAELMNTLETVRVQQVRFLSLEDEMDTRATLSIITFLNALMKMDREVIGERLQSGRKKVVAVKEVKNIAS